MSGLFRLEALQAQSAAGLGRVLLARPLSVAWMTAGAALALVAVLAFLVLAQTTRRATVPGVLVPDLGVIRIVPPLPGRVLERRVAEGQAVRAGDVLMVLAQERPTPDPRTREQLARSLADRARSLRESAQQQQALLAQQQTALGRRLQALDAELAQAEAERALQRQRLVLAQESLARTESLSGAQFVSPAQVQARREELLAVQAAAQALQRQQSALQRERAELEGELRALPLRAQGSAGGIERDLAALSREAAELDAAPQFVLRAPQDATVTSLPAEVGQSVSTAAAVVALVPAGAVLQAQLFAPSRAVGFVRPGQTVLLRYEAFPYQKHGQRPGRVLSVSRTPLAPSELAALALGAGGSPQRGDEPLFRITVALEEPPAGAALPPLPLVAGLRLDADVVLDRRRLIEWLFEPLFGWSART